MKKCPRCGSTYADDTNFCVKCGVPLVAEQKNVQVNNTPGYQRQEVNPPFPDQEKKKTNSALIAVIIILIAAIVISGVVIVIFLTSGNDNGSGSAPAQVTETAEPQSPGTEQAAEEASEPAEAEDQEGSGDAPTDETAEESFDTYQSYYDGVDKTFDKLIVSPKNMGKYSVYIDEMGQALAEKNAEECEKYYKQLQSLEKSIKSSSKKEIDKLKKQIKKLKKKKESKSAKKTAAFVKAETKAETSAKLGDYKTAGKNYNTCIKKLKKAIEKAKKAKKKKSRKSTSTNDDRYRSMEADNYTWQQVYYYQLSSADVRGMSTEEKRYYMNTLFACYGYRFNNSTIQAYFDRQSWYNPDYSISVGDQEEVKSYFDYIAEYNYQMLGGV